MKRTLLFIAYVLTSLAMSAQVSSYFDYAPFVKEGKKWTVVRSDFNSGYHFDRYTLMGEEVVKDGKTYMKMYRSEDDKTVVYDADLLREENRKVYVFDAERQAEFLAFDYSLKAGDTYETYSYDEQKAVTYRVLSVSDFTEGPKLLRESYDAAADSMTTQQRYLQKWVVCRTDDNSHQKTWIEGVGSLESPLANLSDARPISRRDYLAYVEYGDYDFLPFSFYDTLNKQIHGSGLPKGAVDYSLDDWSHQLTYELEGNRLHVYGKAFLNCGSYNYAYFTEELTDDPLVRKLHFQIQEVGPSANCMGLYATNFYVSGFDPNMNYIVVDNHEEEHPVINKTPQMAYRPFVEDDKVWKVGDYNSGNPVQLVGYYYFDGDTIIDGKTCKQMMCQQYANPNYENAQQASLNYVGAWYEENQKVYYYDATSKEFQMMYDFSLGANDTLQINDQSFVTGPRETGGLKGFKGIYRDVANHMAWKTTWLEGVGGLYGPTINIYPGQLYPAWFLMSCTVDDEVIYFNDDYEDGATPEAAGAAKGRFDFTHITKPKPKTPMRREAEQSLYGEYNEQRLGINLDPLDDAYLVRITNESGKVVYEKAINAGNIVALDIDISSFAKGLYIVTVENSRESFTGEFETQTTGIKEVSNKNEKAKSYIYNLQGQRLSSTQKGLNIVGGQKVFVK